jgi:hypothetical protein
VLRELTPRDSIRNICQNRAYNARCGVRAELSGYTMRKFFVLPGILQFQNQSRQVAWLEKPPGVLNVIRDPKQDAVCLSLPYFLFNIFNSRSSKLLIACFMSVFQKPSEQASISVSEASLSIANFGPQILDACLFHQAAVQTLPLLLYLN